MRVQTSPTHTQLATNDFQTKLIYLEKIATALEMIATALRKGAVAIMHSYSPPSTLHPQVMYAKAFSAGLNGLQVV